jgi:hypothetical protein
MSPEWVHPCLLRESEQMKDFPHCLHLHFLTCVYSFMSSKVIVSNKGFPYCLNTKCFSPLWHHICTQMSIKEMKIFSHYLVFLPYEYVQVLNMSQRQDGFSPVLTYISCLPNVVFRVFHITRSTRGFSTLFTLLWFLFPLVYLTRTVTPKGIVAVYC